MVITIWTNGYAPSARNGRDFNISIASLRDIIAPNAPVFKRPIGTPHAHRVRLPSFPKHPNRYVDHDHDYDGLNQTPKCHFSQPLELGPNHDTDPPSGQQATRISHRLDRSF